MIEEVCQSGPNWWGFLAYICGMAALVFFLWWREERSHRIALEWMRDNPGKFWPPVSAPWPAPPPPPPPRPEK